MQSSAARLLQDSRLLMDRPIQPPEGTWVPLQCYWTSRVSTETRSPASPSAPPLAETESLCINMYLMNTRSMFSQFAGATKKVQVEKESLFFLIFYSQGWFNRPPVLASPGLPTTTQSFVLIYSLYPQDFFFSCKVFHIQVSYCTSFLS